MIFKKKTKFGALRGLALATAIGACTVGVSEAAMHVTYTDDVGGLTVSWTGSLDLVGLTYGGVSGPAAVVGAGTADYILSTHAGANYFSYGSSQDVFSSVIGETTATSSGGDSFGFNSVGSRTYLYIPTGYISGNDITGSIFFAGLSVADLGTINSDFSWGPGADQRIAASVSAVPEPSSTALLGLGTLGLLLRRRR